MEMFLVFNIFLYFLFFLPYQRRNASGGKTPCNARRSTSEAGCAQARRTEAGAPLPGYCHAKHAKERSRCTKQHLFQKHQHKCAQFLSAWFLRHAGSSI